MEISCRSVWTADMYLWYGLAPMPQMSHLSGSFLRFVLRRTEMESSSLVRSPSCFSMTVDCYSGKFRVGWWANLKSSIRRNRAFFFAPIAAARGVANLTE